MGKVTQILFLMLFTFMLIGTASAENEATLTLPVGLKMIESEAFCGDTRLEKVVLPEGVQTIGERAFAGSSVREIEIPKSVTFIADDAFDGSTFVTITAPEGSYAYQWGFEKENMQTTQNPHKSRGFGRFCC